MSKKIFIKTVSRVFALLAVLGLFLTCEDPNQNPFVSNMGEKVVVEPPTIYDISPVSGSYLTGEVTFTGTAKAYIEVKKVEVYIYPNEENGQREVYWTDKGIQLTGSIKLKQLSFKFDTKKYNGGKDGSIRMKFRVHDTKAIEESIELIYIIKNFPSNIKLTTPDGSVVQDTQAVPKVNYGGEVQGQVIDRRGLRPGYPQIKIWPSNDEEPADDDPEKGYASMFLPGVGNAEVGVDDLQKENANGPAGPGAYADRRLLPVVRAAQFSFRLAEYDLILDPANPDLRRVAYRVDPATGKHKLYPSGRVYCFRIRTRDTASERMIPTDDPPWIDGFFPPLNYGSDNEDNFQPREEPIRMIIFSADTRPTIEINNDDIKEDPNLGQQALDKKPNIWITEPTSKKISKPYPWPSFGDVNDFRLRLLINHPNGLKRTTLQYRHESSDRFGFLTWDDYPGSLGYFNDADEASRAEWGHRGQDYSSGEKSGKLFTFTALRGLKGLTPGNDLGNVIFTSSSEPYTLIVTVYAEDGSYADQRYVVYMDGEGPNVSIRSVRGAAGEPTDGAVDIKDSSNKPIPGFQKNESPYTVNGNIQVLVNRTDDSGIIAFRPNANMGETPPSLEGYPMVKWIIEEDRANYLTAVDTVLDKLKKFRDDPSADNLKFFNDIKETRTSGWVRTQDAASAIDADKSHNFKFNTTGYDGKTLWLYVIAQDQVQNLGFVVQQIHVVDASDKPNYDVTTNTFKPFTAALEDTSGTIKNANDLKVTVSLNGSKTGNYPEKNILVKSQGIDLNFFDDDGIDLDANGVVIVLTDLNVTPNKEVTLTAAQIKKALPAGNKRDWSGELKQEIMAEALYGLDANGSPKETRLADGMYKIVITVKDDVKEKVAITPAVNPGDTPTAAPNPLEPKTYYFAVSTSEPEVTVLYPEENALGSASKIPVYGTVKSLLKIQILWITFNPDVISTPPSESSYKTAGIDLYTDSGYSNLASGAELPDAEGYYTYYWQMPNLVAFDPEVSAGVTLSGNVRRFTVEAYDILGNAGRLVRTVTKDDKPPVVTLIEFNNGRPYVDGKLYVYGKVLFTVTATDENGLMELEKPGEKKKSGIKWWVIPKTPNPTWPNWNTDTPADIATVTYSAWQQDNYSQTHPNTTSWTGYGNFNLDQVENGRYAGVIDTRWLPKGEYYLCFVAMDKAGNSSFRMVNGSKTVWYEEFSVDQSKDYPVIGEDSLYPQQDSVQGKTGLVIKAAVSDADLFNKAKLATAGYVKIRFPKSTVTGVPRGDPADWDVWVNVVPKDPDPSGTIAIEFDTTASSYSTYFAKDGIKYYQIMVSDEPDAPTVPQTEQGARNLGKNPDLYMDGNPLYPGYKYERNDKVTIVYPIYAADPKNQNPPTFYKFMVDSTPPDIFFDKYDPTKETIRSDGTVIKHDNYNTLRPTYSEYSQLKADLSGHVIEYKLRTLSINFNNGLTGAGNSYSANILTEPNPDANTADKYSWNIKGTAGSWSSADDAALQAVFDNAEQGLQIIEMTATDMVGPSQARSVSWIFYKDTQGPEIIFNNINRSIKRDVTAPSFPGSPAWASGWPVNRYTSSTTDAAWKQWNGTWKGVIENWPSEYGFKKAADIPAALVAENGAQKTTVYASSSGSTILPATLEGTFSDSLSFVRDQTPNVDTFFWYRFKTPTTANDKGATITLPNNLALDSGLTVDNGWIKKKLETKAPGENERSANWKIELTKGGGFVNTLGASLPDGENWFDIKVMDTAGNLSEIFNIRFIIDSADPVLGADPNPDDPDNPGKKISDADEFKVASIANYPSPGWNTPKALKEVERVFSAPGNASSYASAFTLTGTVSDVNLRSLQIILGQEGDAAYRVVASVEIDTSLIGGGNLNGVKTAPVDTVTGTADSPATQKRLSLSSTGPTNTGPNGIREWTWTFSVLQKDIAALLALNNNGSVRRFIRVSATDTANHRVGPEDWFFYLDSKKPVIEYTNLDPRTANFLGSSFESNVVLSGVVSDETRIQDVKFAIGRWDYAANPQVWKWWDGSGWNTAEAAFNSADHTKWPSALAKQGSNNTIIMPAAAASVNWSINQAVLDEANKIKPNTFPANLLNQEGRYRIDLYVTDYSLGSGNPHDTTNGDNTTATGFMDKASTDTGYYKPSTGEGNASARIFIIDRQDPWLEWGNGAVVNGVWVPDTGDVTKDKLYFKNESDNSVIFKFATGDGNTITSWSATLKEGDTVRRSWPGDSGLVASYPDISTTSPDIQNTSIRPYMTTNWASTGGTALDLDPSNTAKTPKTYTLTINVTDGAGRTNSISKQFILDNRPPELSNFRPSSDTVEAVTGKLNVRGNTADNSNQLSRVAFYLAPAGPNGNSAFTFPDPRTTPPTSGAIADADWHWYDQSKPDGGNCNIANLIQIGAGTFNWEIKVPQTSDFKGSSYVQWVKTGTSNTYKDVTFTYDASGAVTAITPSTPTVPALTFADLTTTGKVIPANEDVGIMTLYVLAEDAAGNRAYTVLKYWIWPEGDRPQVLSINNPDSTKIEAERLLNGTIRLSGMARDNEQIRYVWFRVLKADKSAYYTLEKIPVWDENWEAVKTGTLYQSPVEGSTIGSLKSDDSISAPTGGWYMANGGFSKDVSWYAYINNENELGPTGGAISNEIYIEVRAQDVTWDETKNNNQGGWKTEVPGLASKKNDVTAWVVVNAPIFEPPGQVAPDDSDTATTKNLWASIDSISIRNRSSYRVTVKHNAGISAIRWSPTLWEGTAAAGAFKANPNAEAYNLLNLAEGYYIYYNGNNPVTQPVAKATVFADMKYPDKTGAAVPRMAATYRPLPSQKRTGSATIVSGRNYMIWDWNQGADTKLLTSQGGIFTPASDDNDPITGNLRTDLRNRIFAASKGGTVDIGNAVIIEAASESDGNGHTTEYYKWQIIVEVRADLLVKDLPGGESSQNSMEDLPGGKSSQNSIRYPVYLSASEVSKSTPLTTRGDALLPLDQRPPTARYTLNRKPAGTAATIGGEASDTGPVSGIARVVLWFQRGNNFISWHENASVPDTTLQAVSGFKTHLSGETGWAPDWWDKLDSNVIDSGVSKPAISTSTDPTECKNGIGAYAIVIDSNSPTTGQNAWGQNLPTGFADGGDGKKWYVEFNSLGITSGPVTLHYVVMDKAGNGKYYKERLVIMNNAAVISRIRLATDIRDDAALRAANTGWTANASGNTGLSTALSETPVLSKIRNRFTAPDATDIQKGISDWISASALGLTNNIIDFNVRNNLLALRVETTAGPGSTKSRNFRLEYVSSATLIENTAETSTNLATQMKPGRIYVIDKPGTAKWGSIGADGEGPWPRGYAFIAIVSGTEANISGTGSVWELNSTYYDANGNQVNNSVPAALRIPDVTYTANPSAVNTFAVGAEFVYASGAFGTTVGGTNATIVDFGGNDAYPNVGVNPLTDAAARQSMFIIKVFDGAESDTFGDFTIIRVRVNNDDKTKPFAQLYDINPKTEGQDRGNIAGDSQTMEERRSLAPMFIGEVSSGANRTKGGLWNTDTTNVTNVAKSGHIEPRKITSYTTAPYSTQQHSLSSAQMGGAATTNDATYKKPFVNPAGFFTTRDTVSGEVVLRGYAEDDQRIQRVTLSIGGTNVIILDYQNNGTAVPGNPATYTSPRTGLLQVSSDANAAGRVQFADSIDLYRHRVEWAYRWNTETLNTASVGDNVSVRVTSYIRNSANGAGTMKTTPTSDEITAASPITHSNASDATKPNTSPFNPGFPVGMYKYNSIGFNLRPYITGFLRNQAEFAHNTRSSQGRYMFARNETAVVTGFNLVTGNTNAVINLPGATGTATANVGTAGNYGITTASNMHYRQFAVGANAATGNGLVTLTVNGSPAVNTSERPLVSGRPVIQPWNIEYSPAKDGSDLWDDYTQVHIWQSNNTAPGGNNNSANNGSGWFFSRENSKISNPAMSIDPRTGDLYESHNGSGGGTDPNDWYNTSRTIKSPITINTYGTSVQDRARYWVTQFSDPIFFSDVYRSPGVNGIAADTWAVSSIIGRSGTAQYWRGLGGIYISGPGGAPIMFTGGGTGSSANSPSNQNSDYSSSLYYGESTWYNASSSNTNLGNRLATPPSTDQFMNPHIVTSYANNLEHIHVSYYDDKDGSIKYRYNVRGTPGTVDNNDGTDGNNNSTSIGKAPSNNNIPKQWVNLDGGSDWEDADQTTSIAGENIPANDRVKTGRANPAINAGRHNSIAVTSNGYPVIAYYDQTNQRLKLAASNSASPILASNWTITNNISSFGTGEFVSMRIDTKAGTNQNRVHIAAMNTNKRLVYITFILTGTTVGTITEQVVDSVGNTGRWCSLSLDANGNPWISYMDESYLGGRDGVKLAYRDTATFYKGVTGGTYFPDKYIDINGTPIGGWETMHVPTTYRVQNPIEAGREHGRLGMECFPARNYDPNSGVTKFWSGAISYISTDTGMDRYHIAYYVK